MTATTTEDLDPQTQRSLAAALLLAAPSLGGATSPHRPRQPPAGAASTNTSLASPSRFPVSPAPQSARAQARGGAPSHAGSPAASQPGTPRASGAGGAGTPRLFTDGRYPTADGRARFAEWLTAFLGEAASGPLKVVDARGAFRFTDHPLGQVSIVNRPLELKPFCEALLGLFSPEDTGGNVTLMPATQADMRGGTYEQKPSLEVVYDSV